METTSSVPGANDLGGRRAFVVGSVNFLGTLLGLLVYVLSFHVHFTGLLILPAVWLFVGWAVAGASLIYALVRLVRGDTGVAPAIVGINGLTLVLYLAFIVLVFFGGYEPVA